MSLGSVGCILESLDKPIRALCYWSHNAIEFVAEVPYDIESISRIWW